MNRRHFVSITVLSFWDFFPSFFFFTINSRIFLVNCLVYNDNQKFETHVKILLTYSWEHFWVICLFWYFTAIYKKKKEEKKKYFQGKNKISYNLERHMVWCLCFFWINEVSNDNEIQYLEWKCYDSLITRSFHTTCNFDKFWTLL